MSADDVAKSLKRTSGKLRVRDVIHEFCTRQMAETEQRNAIIDRAFDEAALPGDGLDLAPDTLELLHHETCQLVGREAGLLAHLEGPPGQFKEFLGVGGGDGLEVLLEGGH